MYIRDDGAVLAGERVATSRDYGIPSFQTAVEAPSNDLLSPWYRQYQYMDKPVEGQSLD